MLELVVLVPDHCLSFCFQKLLSFQRLRSSIKPVLKKHQLIPGEDLSKVTLEDDYCDDNTQTQLQSTFINGKC